METGVIRNLGIGVAVVVVAALGIYFFTSTKAGAPVAGGNNATSTATSTQNGGANTQGSTGISLVTPDYKKPINFSAEVSADIRAQINISLAEAQQAITKNPLDTRAWVNLGTYRKMGGDYAGAVEAWGFVAEITPKNPVPFFNLGDLYQNFLKDYTKAETNFLHVVEVSPKTADAYINLAYLYRDKMTPAQPAKAKAIVEAGLVQNPGNETLLDLKADLNK